MLRPLRADRLGQPARPRIFTSDFASPRPEASWSSSGIPSMSCWGDSPPVRRDGSSSPTPRASFRTPPPRRCGHGSTLRARQTGAGASSDGPRLADRLHGELDRIDQLLESFLALHTVPKHGLANGQEITVPLRPPRRPLGARGAGRSDHERGTRGPRVEDCPEAMVTGSETLLTHHGGQRDGRARSSTTTNAAAGYTSGRPARTKRTSLVVENGGPAVAEDAAQELAQPFPATRWRADRIGFRAPGWASRSSPTTARPAAADCSSIRSAAAGSG